MTHDPPARAFTRRRFLAATSGAMAAMSLPALGASSRTMLAATGVQLGWLTPELEKDFDGTLHKLAAIGYQDVELLGNFGRSTRRLLDSFNAAGLRCQSNLFPLEPGKPGLDAEISKQIDFAHALGLRYLVCMVPVPMGLPIDNPWDTDPKLLAAALDKLTLDDFKRQAALFNSIGARAKKAGLQFAYHNFNYEFRRIDGVLGYDQLLRSTDPDLVYMEMDCGWLASSGQDPARYLRKYPGRFPVLHVKDVNHHDPNTVFRLEPIEVGRGIVDWQQVLAAAAASGVKIGYVEYEPPAPLKRPLLESAKNCLDYLHTLAQR